jgi:hypothetical protein
VPTFHALQAVWDVVWGAISASALWVWDNVLKPTWDAIVQYGIHPIVAAAHWLGQVWDSVWGWITMVVSNAWLGLKVIWGWIKTEGIDPVWGAAKWLQGEWDAIWKAIGNGVSWVWDHLIAPVFNRIKDGIASIKNGFNDIKNAPGAAGQGLAHLAGFDDGGWVPGAPGAPMLAIVHGGEYVLSRDMIAAGGGRSAVAAMSAPASGGGAALAPIQLTIPVQLGGRTMETLHVALIPHAQRYKQRTGATGLS